MGQRVKIGLMIGILCGMLALTPILVSAQDDAEATPEATAASVVTEEETTVEETTAEETTATEAETEDTVDTEEAVSEETASVVTDSDAPRTLFDAYAVEDAPEEEAEDPAGIGLGFFLVGLAGIVWIGIVMNGRDRVTVS